MPIEFACPACGRKYSVKEKLAGKSAKCGKCAHRMTIPTPPPPEPPKPEPSKQVEGLSSWLDEELEVEPPQPTPTSPAVSAVSSGQGACPSCGAPLGDGAVLCVSCGYDTRIRGRRSTVEVDDTSEATARAASSGGGMSLLRGTIFSFLATMLGAVIWAVLAYLTDREYVIVAWGLGGLAGLGMALGHEDDDGTLAGIIAAFMSLFGIVAAKMMIIAIVLGAMVASVVGDSDELEREFLAAAIANEKLAAKGLDAETVTDQQWEAAHAEASAEVAAMTPAEVEARWAALGEVADAAEDGDPELLANDAEQANPAAEPPADVDEADDADGMGAGAIEGPGLIMLLFAAIWAMFSPFDAIFILFAFFTAYKVGSGEMTD